MYKSSSSRVVPIILILIVVAIAIAVLVSVGRAIFGGSTNTTNTSQTDLGVESLLNTAVDRSVRMTVRGPLVADENFRSYQIAVDSSSRRLTTYSGYLDQTIDNVQLGNSTKAYEEFVYALNRANLMKGDELEDEKNDMRGVCAAGRLYEFEVLQGNSVIKRLWTSTCKGSQGSLKASVKQLETLFQEQIPDSGKTITKVDL